LFYEEVPWQLSISVCWNGELLATERTSQLVSWIFIPSVLLKAFQAKRVQTWKGFGCLEWFQAYWTFGYAEVSCFS
jgi:hypothetical protein